MVLFFFYKTLMKICNWFASCMTGRDGTGKRQSEATTISWTDGYTQEKSRVTSNTSFSFLLNAVIKICINALIALEEVSDCAVLISIVHEII